MCKLLNRLKTSEYHVLYIPMLLVLLIGFIMMYISISLGIFVPYNLGEGRDTFKVLHKYTVIDTSAGFIGELFGNETHEVVVSSNTLGEHRFNLNDSNIYNSLKVGQEFDGDYVLLPRFISTGETIKFSKFYIPPLE